MGVAVFRPLLKRIFAMASRSSETRRLRRRTKIRARTQSVKGKLKSNCGGLGFCVSAWYGAENMCLTLLQQRQPRDGMVEKEGRGVEATKNKREEEKGAELFELFFTRKIVSN